MNWHFFDKVFSCIIGNFLLKDSAETPVHLKEYLNTLVLKLSSAVFKQLSEACSYNFMSMSTLLLIYEK